MNKETEKRFNSVLKSDYRRLQEIEEKKDVLEKEVENLTNDEKQESEKFLSYVVMRGVSEDFREYLHLLSTGGKSRYQNFIIRNITEHVVEYMYLMTNKQFISEYFGEAIQINLEEEISIENTTQAYRKLGQNRYQNRRPSVKKMCESIGEENVQNGILGLYDVFSIVSENCHNSYFQAVIDEWSEGEIENDVFNLWLVSIVLVKFLKFING